MPTHPPGYPTEGLFKAAEHEVDANLVDSGPGPSYGGVEAKALTPIELATLGELLGLGRYDELADPMLDSARGGDSGECGVFRVPDSIRDGLADATDLDRLASQWATTDELRYWEPGDARDVLYGASGLAKAARDEGGHLWIWWTL